ncbi:LysR substrate-binding domain-containing protein [Trinickia soli]|jgi:DNA-binding transcriptional LysR family regulator|uniref:LysR family transcriptional regulator n=1 Tax=Trinickia soli TaxID=380675 RepID=A0A2N7W5E8_9BURK|nr:LysR substrate-binding domain-containing protein [Trinickia soli]KAA0090527.1 LysR family transcriptional regulator [Paraburkholderia sp. T12-10]PMS24631.1 LysR family transcriptional regulator [Trinickia soli]CAB3651460.1 Glycine cleavage system transcriptional activator [Trinickia soli]
MQKRTHLPPLQTLRAFEAAVRLESFTRAADELALTQGAVSQHVRALEERLSVQLFVRERGGAWPTPRAQSLALQIRQGLNVLERAFEPPGRLSNRVHRRPRQSVSLTVSVLPPFADRWLAPRLEDFRRKHPLIALELRRDVALARLNGRDGIDVALRYGPGTWPGVQADHFMDEAIFPVMSPIYRNGVRPRRFADLAHCTLLRHRSQPWEPWFQAVGLDFTEPRGGPLFDDANALLEAAANGQGVALARGSLVERDVAEGRLMRLWKRSVTDIYAHYVVWRADSAKHEAIDALRRWLHEEAARNVA